MTLRRVLSGEQTGVDRAALDAASSCGLEIGGWCPPGRASEEGPIPDRYALRETPRDRSPLAPEVPRSQRTEWNVRDSDASLFLSPADLAAADPGTRWALRCAARSRKPLLTVDPWEPEAVGRIVRWLGTLEIDSLSVGGPSEASLPGIGRRSFDLLVEVFSTR